MKSWQEDLLSVLAPPFDERAIFEKITVAARGLDFEYCSYGARLPYPLSSPKVIHLSAYPDAWTKHYQAAHYHQTDPTVLLCSKTQAPVIWSDSVFASTPKMWDEVRAFGIEVGWAQSSLDLNGVGGMLTLARSRDPLSRKEFAAKEQRMEWLVAVSHLALMRTLTVKMKEQVLTPREIEVLRWSGDGKTSGDVARILCITADTVNFHIRNAQFKLGVSNKTAAVVKAAMLGWFR